MVQVLDLGLCWFALFVWVSLQSFHLISIILKILEGWHGGPKVLRLLMTTWTAQDPDPWIFAGNIHL